MDPTGLLSSIATTAINIDLGRKGFATRGQEQQGRISYEEGIDEAMSAFKKASDQRVAVSADPQVIILAEYAFLSQELQFCDETDRDSMGSLTQAIQSFDDAFLALKAVENPGYKVADSTHPHSSKYRVKGFPKDSFHIACIAHKTRLQNILRSPGIDPIEKALLKQRHANLSAAQGGYCEKQRKALAD